LIDQASPVSRLIAELHSEREQFLERARDNAAVTIPDLIRESDASWFSDTETPWESVGAYLLNNLTNKIALSLFPEGVAWHEFKPSRKVKEDLAQLPEGDRAALLLAMEQKLADIERDDFRTSIAADGDVAALTRAINHLLCAGSYCIGFEEDGRLRTRPLTRFWTARGGDGQVYRAAVLDPTVFALLPDDVQVMVALKKFGRATITEDEYQQLASTPVKIYTYQELKNGEWHIHEEVDGTEIPGTKEVRPKDDPRFLFPVYELRDGENFGRSYVEYYVGDLEAIDGQSQVVQEGSAAAAVFLRFVRPGGSTAISDVEEAANLDVLAGNAEDVTTLRADKGSDFQASLSVQNRIVGRLERAFLLTASIQRQGERVTRAEIVTLAQELESQLGGAYALLGMTLQRPYAIGKVRRLQKSNRLPSWNPSLVDVIVLTGAAALGRQKLAENVMNALGALAQLLGPQVLAQRLRADGLIDIILAGFSAPKAGLFLTDAEVQANVEKQQAQQLTQNVAPEMVKQVGEAAKFNAEAQQQQQAQPAQ
jgi:hypothetical protein